MKTTYATATLRRVPQPVIEPSKTAEDEWMESVRAISTEMASHPKWKRRAELLREAVFAVHRYFGKRSVKC